MTKFRLNERRFRLDRYAAVLRRLASSDYPVMITADFEHDDYGPSSACFDEQGNWDGRVCCTINFDDLGVPSRDYVLYSRTLLAESPPHVQVWAEAGIAGHIQQFLEFSIMIDQVHHGYWRKAVRCPPTTTRVTFLQQDKIRRIGWRLRFLIHAAVVDRCIQQEFALVLAAEGAK